MAEEPAAATFMVTALAAGAKKAQTVSVAMTANSFEHFIVFVSSYDFRQFDFDSQASSWAPYGLATP
jgi:hypothetical protein